VPLEVAREILVARDVGASTETFLAFASRGIAPRITRVFAIPIAPWRRVARR
jgi:hypothetical protein